MYFGEFRRRFDCLAAMENGHGPAAVVLDDRQSVDGLLNALEIDRSCVQLGLSQVLRESMIRRVKRWFRFS